MTSEGVTAEIALLLFASARGHTIKCCTGSNFVAIKAEYLEALHPTLALDPAVEVEKGESERI